MSKRREAAETFIDLVTAGESWDRAREQARADHKMSAAEWKKAEVLASQQMLTESMEPHGLMGIAMARLDAVFHAAMSKDDLRTAAVVQIHISKIYLRWCDAHDKAEDGRTYTKNDYIEAAVRMIQRENLTAEQAQRVAEAIRAPVIH